MQYKTYKDECSLGVHDCSCDPSEASWCSNRIKKETLSNKTAQRMQYSIEQLEAAFEAARDRVSIGERMTSTSCPHCHGSEDKYETFADYLSSLPVTQEDKQKQPLEFWLNEDKKERNIDIAARQIKEGILQDNPYLKKGIENLSQEVSEKGLGNEGDKKFTIHDFFNGLRGIVTDARRWWDRDCSMIKNHELLLKHHPDIKVGDPITDEMIVNMYLKEVDQSPSSTV